MCSTELSSVEQANAEAIVALKSGHSPEGELAIRKKLAKARVRHAKRFQRQCDVIEEQIWGSKQTP